MLNLGPIIIKSTQTVQTIGEKQEKSNIQCNFPSQSFNNILSLFNMIESPKTDGVSSEMPLYTETEQVEHTNSSNTQLTDSDWQELGSLTLEWIGYYQQYQQSSKVAISSPQSHSTGGTQIGANSSILNAMNDIQNEIKQLFQPYGGIQQLSTFEKKQLVEHITKHVTEMDVSDTPLINFPLENASITEKESLEERQPRSSQTPVESTKLDEIVKELIVLLGLNDDSGKESTVSSQFVRERLFDQKQIEVDIDREGKIVQRLLETPAIELNSDENSYYNGPSQNDFKSTEEHLFGKVQRNQFDFQINKHQGSRVIEPIQSEQSVSEAPNEAGSTVSEQLLESLLKGGANTSNSLTEYQVKDTNIAIPDEVEGGVGQHSQNVNRDEENIVDLLFEPLEASGDNSRFSNRLQSDKRIKENLESSEISSIQVAAKAPLEIEEGKKLIDPYPLDHRKLDSQKQFMVEITNSKVVEPLIAKEEKTFIGENQQEKIVLPDQIPLKAQVKINSNTNLDGYSVKAGIDESVRNLFVQQGQLYNEVRELYSKPNHTPVQVEILADSGPQEQMLTGGLLHKVQTVQTESPSEVTQSSRVLTINDFVPEVSEWIGRFVKVSHGFSGSSEAKFLLNPEHLGRLEIKITSQQGHIVAQILTDTTVAKETLEGQLSVLKQALQQQGLQVQKLEIVHQIPSTFDVNQGNHSFSNEGNNQHFNQSNEQGTYTPKDGSKHGSENDSIQSELEQETPSFTYGGVSARTTSRIDFSA